MFDQSTITSVGRIRYVGNEMRLRWESSSPPGTTFQVYVAGRLAWHGTQRQCSVPWRQSARIMIGAVGSGEESTNFADSISGVSQDHAVLRWLGGTYLDQNGNDDIAGFHVYGESTPGGGVDYSSALATIAAYDNGIITDGWGEGGWGEGGWGQASSSYEWRSNKLTNGIWTFAVASFDKAGNEAIPSTVQVQIATAPKPPAFFSDGERVHFTWNPDNQELTISWNASPG